MKSQYTWTDDNKQKLTITRVAKDYLITFGGGNHRVQIPKERLTYILLHLEEEQLSNDSSTN